MGWTLEDAEQTLCDLLEDTVKNSAPDVEFVRTRLGEYHEPGVGYSTLGYQYAARGLNEGVAREVCSRVVEHWRDVGWRLDEDVTGIRAVNPDGFVLAVNAGARAVILDGGTPPVSV
jgi:hypothetical protein